MSGFDAVVARWSVDLLGSQTTDFSVQPAVVGVTGITGPNGSGFALQSFTTELNLTGASVDWTAAIPENSIVHACAARVTQAVTGATGLSIGTVASPQFFVPSLGASLGSTNRGLVGAPVFLMASPMAVRATAIGSNFTGGRVRLVLFVSRVAVPAS